MDERMLSIASHFAIEGEIEIIKPLGEGFINDTFIVKTAGNTPNYILQRKNHAIFPDVPAMMDNIAKVTAHLKEKIAAAGGDPRREALTVTPTVDGKLYWKDNEGNYWAVCEFIEGSVTYDRADTPELACKGGQGIGRFQAQLADFTEPLAETIKALLARNLLDCRQVEVIVVRVAHQNSIRLRHLIPRKVAHRVDVYVLAVVLDSKRSVSEECKDNLRAIFRHYLISWIGRCLFATTEQR